MIIVRRGRGGDRSRRASELEEVYRALLSPHGTITSRSTGTWRPPIDVYEEPGLVVIVAEIAGMNGDDIEIVIDGETVSLRGARFDQRGGNERSFHEAHIPYGKFAADIYIPFAIDADQASATYENGFLTISLPRIQGRRIVPSTPIERRERDRSDA
jgi:HSP20 family protein